MLTQKVCCIQIDESSAPLQVGGGLHLSKLIPMRPRASEWFDLYYIAEGELVLVTQDEERSVNEGEFCCLPPAIPYGFRNSSRDISGFHCHVKFPSATIRTIDSDLQKWANLIGHTSPMLAGMSKTLFLPDQIAVDETALLAEGFLRLIKYQRGEAHGFRIAAEAQLALLLQMISQQTVRYLQSAASRKKLAVSEVHVSRAMEFVASNKSRMISLVDIADHLDVNAEYLARIFKLHMDMTVGSYIAQAKINTAKELLLSSYKNVTQVAASLGYRDPLYFSRQFRKQTGVSPRAYLARYGR